jgi:hypothetical protein
MCTHALNSRTHNDKHTAGVTHKQGLLTPGPNSILGHPVSHNTPLRSRRGIAPPIPTDKLIQLDTHTRPQSHACDKHKILSPSSSPSERVRARDWGCHPLSPHTTHHQVSVPVSRVLHPLSRSRYPWCHPLSRSHHLYHLTGSLTITRHTPSHVQHR